MGFIASYVKIMGKIWPLILLLWTGLLIFGAFRALHFIESTDNTVPETPGSQSQIANDIMREAYPDQFNSSPWVMVIQCPESDITRIGCHGDKYPVINDNISTIIDKINNKLQYEHPKIFNYEQTLSYYRFNDSDLDKLKYNFISTDGHITYVQWAALFDLSQSQRFAAYDTLKELIEFLRPIYCPTCFIGITGADPLTNDVSSGIAKLMLHTNAVILPIAIGIIIYMVGSWRLLIITLFNVCVVVLGTFAIADWISQWAGPTQSITPQIIEAISIAITIDYALFLFTRFVNELRIKKKRWGIRRELWLRSEPDESTKIRGVNNIISHDQKGLPYDSALDSPYDPAPQSVNPSKDLLFSSLVATIEHSGHVVIVSGMTLLVAFSGFWISGCTFLIYPALYTAIGIALSMLTALTTTAAFIQAWPSFFVDFNILPSCFYCCCPRSRKTMLFDTDFTGGEIFVDDPDGNNYNRAVQAAEAAATFKPNYVPSHTSFAYQKPLKVNITPDSALLNTNIGITSDNYGTITNNTNSNDHDTEGVTTTVDLNKLHKSYWYRIGKQLIKFPGNVITLFIVYGIMIWLSIYIKDIKLSSAYSLGIPRDSPAHAALEVLQEGFFPGIIMPFELMMRYTPSEPIPSPGPAFSEFGLTNGLNMLQQFLEKSGMKPENTRSPFYWDGKYITDADTFQELIMNDKAYQATWGLTVSPPMPTSEPSQTPVIYRIDIVTSISPDDGAIVDFIRDMRSNLLPQLNDIKPEELEFFLTGYKVQEQDTIDHSQDRFPLMLSITCIMVIIFVALLLKSVFVFIRLLLTLVLPLTSTFGLSILVYQHGILDWTGIVPLQHNHLRAFYWDIPVFAAVVLLSLALDYDVFIILRIIEYRINKFSNESSILLALYDTSSTINAAGIVMALTFSGLLFMKAEAVCQLGFLLASSVLIDTFIVRPILVPCIICFADKVAWWPRKLPMNGLRGIDGNVQYTLK